jgi:hypothetical protein
MSPRRVLLEHSSAELTEWRAFDRAVGLESGSDWRAGMVMAAVWNAAGGIPDGSKGARRAASPADFFPRLAVADRDDEGASDVLVGVNGDAPDDGEVVFDEKEAATQRLRTLFGMWGLAHNARVRKAREMEKRLAEEGQPPGDPDQR